MWVMSNRRLWVLGWLVAATAAVLLALSAAGSAAPLGTDQSGRSSALPSGTYVIGYDGGFTGRLTFYESAFLPGLKAQIAAINARGGVGGKLKLKLITRDMKSDPAQGAIVARELINSDKVQFAISPGDADTGIPAATVFQQAKIPVVMSSGSAWTFPEIVGDYAFLNHAGTAALGAAQAEFAMSRGWKRACDFSSNDFSYAKNISDNFDARYKQLGGKLVCHKYYKLSDTDFRAVAAQLASAKPDVIVTTSVFPGNTSFLKALRAQGYKGPLLWSDSIDANAAYAAGKALDNVYFLTDACGNEPSAKKLTAAIRKSTGKAPDGHNYVLGGDLALAIQAALLKAKSVDPTAVRDALASLQNAPGISGPVTYKNSPAPRVPVKKLAVLKYSGTNRNFSCVTHIYPKKIPGIKS
jgi:branched-chain amino acid transport system substrate-binding protein